MLPLQRVFRSGIRLGEAVFSVRKGSCLGVGRFGVGCCGWRFFCEFGSIPRARSVEDVVEFGVKRGEYPSGGANQVVWGVLLSSWGGLKPPGFGRFMSELWDRDGDVEMVLMGLGGRGGFLGMDASFDLSEVSFWWSIGMCYVRLVGEGGGNSCR